MANNNNHTRNFFFLCTLPSVTDFRFLFDLSRLTRAVQICNNIGDVSKIPTYLIRFGFLTSIPTNILSSCTQSDEVVNEISEPLQLKDPNSFLSDLSSYKVAKNDTVVVWITNQGHSLSKKEFINYQKIWNPPRIASSARCSCSVNHFLFFESLCTAS